MQRDRADAVSLPIGAVLRQTRRPVSVVANDEYRLVGCRWYGDGLFERECRMGFQVGTTKLFALRSGDFVYNRLFAWKASFGIVTPDLDGATVSGEFPTFEVDPERVVPEYLLAATLTASFLDEVVARSSGSTPTSRNRLKEGQFEAIKVAIPPLPAQKRVVARLADLDRVRLTRARQMAVVDALVPAALNEAFAGLS